MDIFFYYRLQTGMRGAFGKPQGTVARVHIGQPIMSVRARDQHKAPVIEALRRAKFKYPGRQKVNLMHFRSGFIGQTHPYKRISKMPYLLQVMKIACPFLFIPFIERNVLVYVVCHLGQQKCNFVKKLYWGFFISNVQFFKTLDSD